MAKTKTYGKKSREKKGQKPHAKRVKPQAAKPKKAKKAKKPSYKAQIKAAYNLGWKSGWEDRDKLPDVVGAESTAKRAYDDGLRDKRRSNSYQTKLGK